MRDLCGRPVDLDPLGHRSGGKPVDPERVLRGHQGGESGGDRIGIGVRERQPGADDHGGTARVALHYGWVSNSQTTIALVNGSGQPVSGASVSIVIYRDSTPYATGSSSTASTGSSASSSWSRR